jgi:hypothetical protein
MENINELSDEELDKMFRNAAENSTESKEEVYGWEQLAKRLDGQKPSAGFSALNSKAVITVAGLLIGLLSYLFYTNTDFKAAKVNPAPGQNEAKTKGNDAVVPTKVAVIENGTKNPQGKEAEGKEDKGLKIIAESTKGVPANIENKSLKSEEKAVNSKAIISKNRQSQSSTFPRKEGDLGSNSFSTKKESIRANNGDERLDNVSSVNKRPIRINEGSIANGFDQTLASAKGNRELNDSRKLNENFIVKGQNTRLSEANLTNKSGVKDESYLRNANSSKAEVLVSAGASADGIKNASDTPADEAIKRIPFNVQSLKMVGLPISTIMKTQVNQEVKAKAVKPKETKKEDLFVKGLHLQVGLSPDLSIINSGSSEKIGRNSVLAVQYRLNSRWSLQTGLIKSIKYYSAAASAYNFSWKPGANPIVNVAGSCRMLDIPLNVRYDYRSANRLKLFVNGGVSSYHMLHEKYNYTYENNYDPNIKYRSWTGKTGFYAAGVINLSSGIEYKLGKKVSFMVEPFAKMPIRQLGFGKVKLQTYGVFVSGLYPFGK